MTDETDDAAPSTDSTEPTMQGEKPPPGLQPDAPPDNEFKGRGFKKKKPKGEKAKRPAKSQVEEQIDAALAQSAMQEKKKLRKKKQFKYGASAAGILLVGYVVYWGLKPYQGGMAFGICKTFLEGTVRYPQYLRVSTVEELDTSVRIWYTQVDSFGEYRMEPIQCYYKQDPERGTMVDKVLVNRREVDRKMVDDFNRALPAIVSTPMDLTIPSPLPDSLQDLQIETAKFRKPIL